MHHLLQCLGPRLHLRRAPFNPCWRRRPLAHREPKSRPASPRGGRKTTDGANTRDRECSRSTYNREKLVEKRGKPERRVTEQSRILAALCDSHRVKSTLTHCNILPTIKMQTFSCFSCNHRIRAFTSKISKRRNGNEQHRNYNDPKLDKHAARK